MQITLNVNVLVKDGALVLTDHTGKPVTFSKEQTAQQKVSMIVLGELCDLPKRQLATGFGFKTRKSYYDIRNAVLNGSLADLLPKRPAPDAPHPNVPRRSKRVSSAHASRPISICMRSLRCSPTWASTSAQELVGQVLADYGLTKKTGLTGSSPRAAPRPRGDRNPRWRLQAAPTPRHSPRHRS